MKKNIILLIIILYSCHPFYCHWKEGLKTVKRISQKDLFGKYVSKNRNSEIVLYIYKNGKFEMTNLNEEIKHDFSINQRNTIVGTWYFSSINKDFKIELSEYTIMPIMIDRKKNLSLPLTIGDPDECKGYIFKRVTHQYSSK